jgi:DNA helicase IV
MWPVLTPAQLLHDLFGSKPLIRSASGHLLTADEQLLLYRPRMESVDEVAWSAADVALLDDAREALGPRPNRAGKFDDADEIRTYGHIVVDEVQDLSPMELKMISRRSLNGSMTVVGDIAQATGPSAPSDWEDVLEHLPTKREPRVIGLSVGYRIPQQIMNLANRVMAAAAPGLRAPESVRDGDADPRIISTDDLCTAVAKEASRLSDELAGGSIAVVATDDRCDELSDALNRNGIAHGRAAAGLGKGITVVPVSVVKGLELDGVIVVEPTDIVEASDRGLRSLFVALTRSTRRLSVVHARSLPESMMSDSMATSSALKS